MTQEDKGQHRSSRTPRTSIAYEESNRGEQESQAEIEAMSTTDGGPRRAHSMSDKTWDLLGTADGQWSQKDLHKINQKS